RRYLLHQRSLLADLEQDRQVSETPLRVQRAEAVLTALREVGAHRVVDMGCGTGALLVRLQRDRSFTRIVGVDVSARALERAARTLHLAEASDAERDRIELLHGSVVYRDERLAGYDAIVLMEVIEHVDPSRLAALRSWAEGVAGRHGYTVEHQGVGEQDAALGAPTQLALFRKAASAGGTG